MSKFYQPTLFLTVCALYSSSAFAAVKEYHLTIAEQTVNITGKPVQRITVNGQFPAPALEFEEGDEAVIHVNNKLKNQISSLNDELDHLKEQNSLLQHRVNITEKNALIILKYL